MLTQEADCFCALAPRIETKQRPKKYFIWWSVCLKYWKPCVYWGVVLKPLGGSQEDQKFQVILSYLELEAELHEAFCQAQKQE